MPPILLREWWSAGKRASLVEHLVESCGAKKISTLVEDPNLIEEYAYSRRREEEIGAVNVVEAIHNCVWRVEEFVKELDSVTAMTTSC